MFRNSHFLFFPDPEMATVPTPVAVYVNES